MNPRRREGEGRRVGPAQGLLEPAPGGGGMRRYRGDHSCRMRPHSAGMRAGSGAAPGKGRSTAGAGAPLFVCEGQTIATPRDSRGTSAPRSGGDLSRAQAEGLLSSQDGAARRPAFGHPADATLEDARPLGPGYQRDRLSEGGLESRPLPDGTVTLGRWASPRGKHRRRLEEPGTASGGPGCGAGDGRQAEGPGTNGWSKSGEGRAPPGGQQNTKEEGGGGLGGGRDGGQATARQGFQREGAGR